MKGHRVNIAEALVLLIGAGTSLFFLSVLKINNLTAWVIFGGLVLAPYFVGAAWCYSLKRTLTKNLSNLLALFTAVSVAIYIMVDAIYLHPDPQGGLAVLMVPIIQVPIYLVVYALAAYIGSKRLTSGSS